MKLNLKEFIFLNESKLQELSEEEVVEIYESEVEGYIREYNLDYTKCPKCDAIPVHSYCESGTHINHSEAVFHTGVDNGDDCDPYEEWIEKHQCKCGEVYYYKNGC